MATLSLAAMLTMKSTQSTINKSMISTGGSFPTNAESLAGERWNVEKKRMEWNTELEAFRKRQEERMLWIEDSSNEAAKRTHEKIFFTVRWANPKLSSAFEKLLFEYCDHLLSPQPDAPFANMNFLVAWFGKYRIDPTWKVSNFIEALVARLRHIVLKRDRGIVKTFQHLQKKTEKLTVKKEGQLRWMMERNKVK